MEKLRVNVEIIIRDAFFDIVWLGSGWIHSEDKDLLNLANLFRSLFLENRQHVRGDFNRRVIEAFLIVGKLGLARDCREEFSRRPRADAVVTVKSGWSV